MADKPKTRWCQFRLKTLLLIVAVLCVPLAWVGMRMNQKRQERAVIAELEELGGTVFYDWQWIREHNDFTHYSFKLNPEPTGPTWLRWLLSDDFFGHVIYVNLKRTDTDPPVKDDDLQLVATFSMLEFLELTNTKIGDNGLAHLKGLTSLRILGLNGADITDTGFRQLESLKALQFLVLFGTKTTKAAVADLAKALPKCRIAGP